MKDLALLVADKDMELALQAALRRPESLSVRPFTFTCIKHPERDGGVRSNGASVLSVMASSHSHALLVLDFEGSGATGLTVEALESRLDAEMQPVWKDRGKSIVIAPELDASSSLFGPVWRDCGPDQSGQVCRSCLRPTA